MKYLKFEFDDLSQAHAFVASVEEANKGRKFEIMGPQRLKRQGGQMTGLCVDILGDFTITQEQRAKEVRPQDPVHNFDGHTYRHDYDKDTPNG